MSAGATIDTTVGDARANDREAALQLFAAEAQDLVARAEGELDQLESRPEDLEILDGLLQLVVRLEGAAGRASFDAARELMRGLARLIERLRTLGRAAAAEHFRLLQRTLAVLAESTADCVTGATAPHPEMAVLGEQLAQAVAETTAGEPETPHQSIDLALWSVVAGVAAGAEVERRETRKEKQS
ncbi:MAG TPA: hypothetical protein VF841_07435 [Anaeromyxobacter sp.]